MRGHRQGAPLRNNHPPAGAKSGENRLIFPTFVQLGVKGRRKPYFFDKLKVRMTPVVRTFLRLGI